MQNLKFLVRNFGSKARKCKSRALGRETEALKAHAKERHVKEYNAFKILMSSVGNAISDSLIEKLAKAETRITQIISHTDLVRVSHHMSYKKRVSEVMADLEATASNSGTTLIGGISMNLSKQEAEVLSQDPALSSSEITDLLLTTNDDMTQEQIQVVKSSPTYKGMVANTIRSPSRVTKNSSYSSVFVPDTEVANPNVFEPPLREPDAISQSQATGAVPKILSKKRVRLSVTDNGQASSSKRQIRNREDNKSVDQQIFEEDAEAVERPMDIASSPIPVGPLRNDSAPIESVPSGKDLSSPLPLTPKEFAVSRDGLIPNVIYSYLNRLVFAKNKGTLPSKNLPRKVRSLLASRYVYRLKDDTAFTFLSALEVGPTFNKLTNLLIRDSLGGFTLAKRKGASDRGSFYTKKALKQALLKDFEGWAEKNFHASKADDRSPTPVGCVLFDLQKGITVDEVKNCLPSAGAGKDPLGKDGGMFRSLNIPVITKLFNKVLLTGELPSELLCGNTSFIPKKEDTFGPLQSCLT
ncbi:unnamed protein product [Lepeophtheirus salmonis]|uniref:(salmon louse) hypothetical protein n=1 Tax=Lepeophtheirus salmonis TaxID=72036 RepID=A0A7R8CCW7_LEPSM|nr:unnamed protein product [Lepeophtheirus salmonis]CAF2773387.1 unnamed protein product [Lepeophtheirus salmonis]